MKQEGKIFDAVCFGEVLWDILPASAVPGGAPVNVAYHLHKLKRKAAVITRVGNDEKGKDLKNIFSSAGVCTDYFQNDEQYETGKVFATISDSNEAVYDIVKPSAWDFIEYSDDLDHVVSGTPFFIYGSLASREKKSAATLNQLLEVANVKVADINLRAPHYSQEKIEELISFSDFLKLNESELEIISGWYADHSSLKDRAAGILKKFNLSRMVVTLGAKGALLFWDGHEFFQKSYSVEVKDTVGSGDAFLAGFLSQWMKNSSPDECLQFASAMGAFIASKTGACPVYKFWDIENFIRLQETKEPGK